MNSYIQYWPDGEGQNYEVLFVRKLKEIEPDEEKVEKILRLIDDICPHCWDTLGQCYCWNDE